MTMFAKAARAAKQGWLRIFVMGVGAGLAAQALANGWHWLREPALGASRGKPANGIPPA